LLDHHQAPFLKDYLPKYLNNVCHLQETYREVVRRRYLLDPGKQRLYVAWVEETGQIGRPFEEAVAGLLLRDEGGVVVVAVSDRYGVLPWEEMRQRIYLLLKVPPQDGVEHYRSYRHHQRFFLTTLPHRNTEERDGLIRSADALLDPFPHGSSMDIVAKALLGCHESGKVVPVITLPSHQYYSQAGASLYSNLLLPWMMKDLSPLATSPREYIDKAIALATNKNPPRRKLHAFIKELVLSMLPYDEEGLEEGIRNAIIREIKTFVTTVRVAKDEN